MEIIAVLDACVALHTFADVEVSVPLFDFAIVSTLVVSGALHASATFLAFVALSAVAINVPLVALVTLQTF